MFSEQQSQLLTAFVDGELSRRERKAALRLLNKSSEARRFLRELQEDAHRLHELPTMKLEPDFSDQLLATIAEQQLPAPTVTVRQSAEVTPARFLRAALAATILIAATLGVYYFFFNDRSSGPQRVRVVDKDRKVDDLVLREPTIQLRLASLTIPKKRTEFADEIRQKFAPKKQDAPAVSASTVGLIASAGGHGNIIASGALFPGRVKKGVHLELPCIDGKEAVGRLTKALKKSGIDLVMPNLQKTDTNTEFVVFAENLNADQVTEILAQLGDDKKSGSRPAQFDTVAVSAFNSKHQTSLAGLMGVRAGSLEPLNSDPLPPELFKKFIVPKGDNVPAPKKKAASPPKRVVNSALVVANNQNGNDKSRIASFLDNRHRHQPGTMQVVFVLRPGQRA